ncbi:hypothetical protein ACKGJO_02800 [Gracilimonas sp. Q87]|uniref:hypothetical protein n=1 Tax=Gracilimonas sp. Q87 TaxID=3384766 RepID=UPI0039841FF5
MKKSVIFILALLLSPFCTSAQSAQAVMEVKVEIVSEKGIELLNIKIDTPEKSIEKDITQPIFSGTANELIEKEVVLFYKIINRPNQKLIVELDTVQQFKNSSNDKIFFTIHSVGYSHTPDKDSIKYFTEIDCNELTTDKDGKAYLYVDGHFFFPEPVNGEFSNTIQFTALQCHKM